MTNPLTPSALLTPLVSSAAMRVIVSDRARLQRMLDVEVTLARAQASLGVIPASAIDPIAAAARAERCDPVALGEAAVAVGNRRPCPLFDLMRYQGAAQTFIDRLFGSLRRATKRP